MKKNKILMITLLSLSIVACNNGATGSTASSSNSTTSSPEGVTSTMAETNTSSSDIYYAFIFNAPEYKVYNVVLYDYDEDKEKQGKLKAQDIGSKKNYNGTWEKVDTNRHCYYRFTIDGKSYWGYKEMGYDNYYVYGNLDDAITELFSDRIGQVHDLKYGEAAIVLAKKWGL